MTKLERPPSIDSPTFGYMMVGQHVAIAANWEQYKGYTVRPLPSTEMYYQSVIDRFGNVGQPTLIYGGTPEIRSCAQSANLPTTLVDRSPTMVYAMGLLTSSGSMLHNNERVVQGNWLRMPINDSSIGIALGDDAVNMVPWEFFGEFVRETHRILQKDGLFACHLLVQPKEKYRHQSAADVIYEYERGMIDSDFDLASRINFTFYGEETYQMGWQRSIAGLRYLIEAGEIDSDYGFIQRFSNCNSIFACPPQRDWEKTIEPFFSIEEIFYPAEYEYCRFEPLYLLRKR